MKICLTVILLFVTLGVFSQSHIYTIRLFDVAVAEDIKIARASLYPIFDVTPDYNELDATLRVKSDTDIESADFVSKLFEMGYSVIFFKKDEKTTIE